MKPLLLIDVDGVLNVYDGGKKIPEGSTQYKVGGYRLWLNPKHGEWLTGLQNRYDLVWATTWEEEAPELIAPLLKLPEMPFIPLGDLGSDAYKVPGVEKYVGERPFAWIDDDFAKVNHEWAAERTARGIPTLLLDIDPRMGLMEHHIGKLITFADGIS